VDRIEIQRVYCNLSISCHIFIKNLMCNTKRSASVVLKTMFLFRNPTVIMFPVIKTLEANHCQSLNLIYP